MNMTDRILRALVPTETVVEAKADGRVKETVRKLYPGYVFVEMRLVDGENGRKIDDEAWYVVRNTTGVTGFVGAGNMPLPLADYEVEALLRQDGSEEATKVELNAGVGDEVRILDGAFKGLMGSIMQINEEKERLLVGVSMFGGRETPVELEYHQVLKVEE